tara:strand:+ start:249 stop:1682 length:1434 start_codon:yes stop_codon:yes gene_type:complete
MKKNKTLIMIPTYNEINNIKVIISKFKKLKTKTTLLFIDDNSPDGTGKALETYKKENHIHVIHRQKKLGIGSAHLEGIKWAYKNGFSSLTTLDGDLTHSLEDVDLFLTKIHDFDIIVGSRFLIKDSLLGWSIYRKFLTYFGDFITTFLLRLPFDSTCGFRSYNLSQIDRNLFNLINSNSYSFFIESLFILKENKARITEIPIILPVRTYGNSKMRISDIFYTVFVILKLFYQKCFLQKNFNLPKKILLNEKLLKRERYEWDEYWKEKTSFVKHIYNFIAFFYRVVIIKPALRYFFLKYNKSFNSSKSLHAGCGSGQVDTSISNLTQLTAIDISPNALSKYEECHNTDVEIIHGDIFKMPFQKKNFNIIFNLGVMEHFREIDIQKILKEFKRVLKDDGKIILFWPPEYGLSVNFLKFVKKMLFILFRKDFKFHPDELTRIKSETHSKEILEKSGFKIIRSYFGIRDFFTHQIIVAEKI